MMTRTTTRMRRGRVVGGETGDGEWLVVAGGARMRMTTVMPLR